MNILEEIKATKLKEVQRKKELISYKIIGTVNFLSFNSSITF